MAEEKAEGPGVFINCPFDSAFEPILDAIFFTIVASGFRPRSALEGGRQGVLRLVRILDALNDSLYSVHDLSRSVGEGDGNLARFNMPLELGMAIQLWRSHDDAQKAAPHDFFIMTGVHANYDKFASDLKGYDIESHDESPERAVELLVEWLQTKPGAASHATKPHILRALPLYVAAKKKRIDEVGSGWAGLIAVAASVAADHLHAG
jgi:hypothetical protein